MLRKNIHNGLGKKKKNSILFDVTANETDTTTSLIEIRSNVFGAKLKTFTSSTLPEFGSDRCLV